MQLYGIDQTVWMLCFGLEFEAFFAVFVNALHRVSSTPLLTRSIALILQTNGKTKMESKRKKEDVC